MAISESKYELSSRFAIIQIVFIIQNL